MKMACFHAMQPKIDTDAQAIQPVWSMVNTVDIVLGALYWPEFFGDEPAMTSYSLAVDLTGKTYYLRTYDNFDIRKIDLNAIDFAKVDYQEHAIFTGANYPDFEFHGAVTGAQAEHRGAA